MAAFPYSKLFTFAYQHTQAQEHLYGTSLQDVFYKFENKS